MIVAMKKLYLVVQRKDATGALEALREFGEVHVENQQTPFGQDLILLREDTKNIERVLAVIKDLKEKVPQKEIGSDWVSLVDAGIEAIEGQERLQEIITKRAGRIQFWEPWGDFNPEDIRQLRAKGIFIKLCEVNPKEKHYIPPDIYFEKVFSAGGLDRCLAYAQYDFGHPHDEVPLPSAGLSVLRAEQADDQKKLADCQAKIKELMQYKSSLEAILSSTKEDLQFQEVLSGMGKEENLVYLKGYCPAGQTGTLQEKARKEHWAVMITDPTSEDQVPTLLKNPRWVELGTPVLDVIEVTPGYKEVDVSVVFIFFFTVFFGMLIGDAAYGTIFFVLTAIAHRKLKHKIQDPIVFYLLYILTGVTILWGVLTGTYFGQAWLPSSVQPVVPWLNDPHNLQWLCFTIALAHLSIARLWAFKTKLPDLTALAELGWLLVVWGMYFLANMFVLGESFPAFAKWFFIIGISLAFIFMVPFKKFATEVPQKFIPFVLGVIGAGTDIVSYVRLFAVGLATVAVADAANNMPGADLPFGLNYFLFIFLHLLNMILAIMAILVHAVRLNVLEFSGHLGLEWAGFKYAPFRKKIN